MQESLLVLLVIDDDSRELLYWSTFVDTNSNLTESRMKESLLVLLVIDDDSRELLCCSTFEETNNSIKFRMIEYILAKGD